MSPDVVKKPSAAPNVNDKGSSANDSQPLTTKTFLKALHYIFRQE